MSTHTSDANDRRLIIARTVYDALVAQTLTGRSNFATAVVRRWPATNRALTRMPPRRSQAASNSLLQTKNPESPPGAEAVDQGGVAGRHGRSPFLIAKDLEAPRLSRRYNPRVSSTRLFRDNRRSVFFARLDCSLHRNAKRFVHLFLDRTYRHFFDN